MGKASTRAQNRYIAKAYDRINLTVPKGKKDVIQAHAEARKESVNGFINRAMSETIERDNLPADSQQASLQAPGASAVAIQQQTLNMAQNAAEVSGESLPAFIDRAIEETADRDTLKPEEIFYYAVNDLASHFNRSHWDILRWLEDGKQADKREMERDTLTQEEIFYYAVKDLAHHFNSSERDVIRWLIDGSQADKKESEG